MSTYNHILAMAQRAAKNYRGGITALALVMGKSPVVLANKLNPNNDNHHLTMIEFAEIVEVVQDKYLLETLADLVNCILVDSPALYDHGFGGDSIESFIKVGEESANLGREIVNARRPDSPSGEKESQCELLAIEKQADKLIQAVLFIKYFCRQRRGEV